MKNLIIIIFLIFSYPGFSQILPSMHGVHDKKGLGGGSGSGTRNFTNCSATGKNGPTQSNCNTAYASTDLNGEVSVSNGIQSWIVPANATYTIVAYGAQGGGPQGGLGAKISGQFILSAGEVIKILVGQQGEKEDTYDRNASGGGGTFVTKSPHNDNNSILVIAGGGAGAFVDPGNQNHHGQTGTSGADGYIGTNGGTGGSSGGAASNPSSCAVASASGFSSNGFIGACGTSGGVVAKSYTNGGVGGMSGWGECYSTSGGFGGAGGAGRCWPTTYACGGGGGYSGGGHMYQHNQNNISNAWAGGGGSYNNGSNTSNTAGNNSGHGKVTITW